jgi:prefoldin beta subunit
MSDNLPPQIQEQIVRLQQLQQTLQVVMNQRQQLDLELNETERAIVELEKQGEDAVIYKSVGSLLVKSEKTGVLTELKERKELLNTRITVLTKQEERTREKLKELQQRLQERLKTPSTTAQ